MGHWAVASIVAFKRITIDPSRSSIPTTGSSNGVAGSDESHATNGAVCQTTSPSPPRKTTDGPSTLAFRSVENAVTTPVSPSSFTRMGGVIQESSIVSLIRSGNRSYFAPGTFDCVSDPSTVSIVTAACESVARYGQFPVSRSISDACRQAPSQRRYVGRSRNVEVPSSPSVIASPEAYVVAPASTFEASAAEAVRPLPAKATRTMTMTANSAKSRRVLRSPHARFVAFPSSFGILVIHRKPPSVIRLSAAARHRRQGTRAFREMFRFRRSTEEPELTAPGCLVAVLTAIDSRGARRNPQPTHRLTYRPKSYRAVSASQYDDAFQDGHPDAVPGHRRDGPREQRRLPVIRRTRPDAVLHAIREPEDARRDRLHPRARGHRFRVAGGVGRRDPRQRVAVEDRDVVLHTELRGLGETQRPDPRAGEERPRLVRLREEEVEADPARLPPTPRGGPRGLGTNPFPRAS